MSALLFGSTGYFGRHLAQYLRERGDSIATPTRADGGRVDLTDRSKLDGIDWNVDSVHLFAGVTGTAAGFDNYAGFVSGNELALLNVLDAIRRSPHRPRVVFPSTRLVYRGADHPLAEDAALEARTVYAANKIACEHLLQAWSNAWDIPYTVLRVCVPYGNAIGDQYSFGTLGNFISQARSTGRIRLYGGGTLRRTFTHISDICRFTAEAASHVSTVNKVFNIPGDDLSLNEAAALVAARLGASLEAAEWPPLDERIESGSTVFDGSRLQAAVGIACEHHLAEWSAGLQRERM